jgi:uncharacterized damage-inducible protein DinB
MPEGERRFPDMWVDPEDDPRQTDPVLADERTTLRAYLRFHRQTLEMKCDGLDAEQLAQRSVEPSSMSLLGLVRHMAEVERRWFRVVMAGEEAGRLYQTPEDPDADWNGAVGDDDVVEDAFSTWRRQIEFADAYLDGEFDLEALSKNRPQGPVSLREVLIHMIEEYARHNGHADLLRERIDGRTGQ